MSTRCRLAKNCVLRWTFVMPLATWQVNMPVLALQCLDSQISKICLDMLLQKSSRGIQNVSQMLTKNLSLPPSPQPASSSPRLSSIAL